MQFTVHFHVSGNHDKHSVCVNFLGSHHNPMRYYNLRNQNLERLRKQAVKVTRSEFKPRPTVS